MASIVKDPNGRKRLVVTVDDKRKIVYRANPSWCLFADESLLCVRKRQATVGRSFIQPHFHSLAFPMPTMAEELDS